MRVALLCGGTSGEREVSLASAAAVESALSKKYEVVTIDTAEDDWARSLLDAAVDGVFVCLHGGIGENGCIQGFCESLELPYTGSGVFASAAAMDKVVSKNIVKESGIATPESFAFRACDPARLAEALHALGDKVVVKPSTEGSALGVQIADSSEDLINAVKDALALAPCVLVERFIEGRELTVAVLGGDDPSALPVVEIVPVNSFYDYESKYVSGMARHVCPADITDSERKACQEMAVAAHRSLGCRGVSRSDCILDSQGKVWYLETNTIPGMTGTSLLPDAAKAAGMGFDELCWRLMEDAWHRG